MYDILDFLREQYNIVVVVSVQASPSRWQYFIINKTNRCVLRSEDNFLTYYTALKRGVEYVLSIL